MKEEGEEGGEGRRTRRGRPTRSFELLHFLARICKWDAMRSLSTTPFSTLTLTFLASDALCDRPSRRLQRLFPSPPFPPLVPQRLPPLLPVHLSRSRDVFVQEGTQGAVQGKCVAQLRESEARREGRPSSPPPSFFPSLHAGSNWEICWERERVDRSSVSTYPTFSPRL